MPYTPERGSTQLPYTNERSRNRLVSKPVDEAMSKLFAVINRIKTLDQAELLSLRWYIIRGQGLDDMGVLSLLQSVACEDALPQTSGSEQNVEQAQQPVSLLDVLNAGMIFYFEPRKAPTPVTYIPGTDRLQSATRVLPLPAKNQTSSWLAVPTDVWDAAYEDYYLNPGVYKLWETHSRNQARAIRTAVYLPEQPEPSRQLRISDIHFKAAEGVLATIRAAQLSSSHLDVLRCQTTEKDNYISFWVQQLPADAFQQILQIFSTQLQPETDKNNHNPYRYWAVADNQTISQFRSLLDTIRQLVQLYDKGGESLKLDFLQSLAKMSSDTTQLKLSFTPFTELNGVHICLYPA